MRNIAWFIVIHCFVLLGNAIATEASGSRIQTADWASAIVTFPDSNRLLTAPYGGPEENIQVWDLDSGQLMFSLQGMQYSTIISASISAAGQILTAHELIEQPDQTSLRLWNGKNGSRNRHFSLPYKVKKALLSPSEQFILSYGDSYPKDSPAYGVVLLLDPKQGKILKRFSLTDGLDSESHESFVEVLSAVLLPGEKQLLTASNISFEKTRIQLWNIATSKEMKRFDLAGLHYMTENSVSRNGSLLLMNTSDIDTDQSITEVISLESGNVVSSLRHDGRVLDAGVFSPDGKYALTGREDNRAVLWGVENGKKVHVLEGHIEKVRSVAFSNDGHTAITASMDKTVRLWDVRTGKEVFSVKPVGTSARQQKLIPRLVASVGHTSTDYVSTATFSTGGGLLLTGSSTGNLILWSVQKTTAIRQLNGHSGVIDSVDISQDKTLLLSGGDDSFVRVWNTITGDQRYQFDCKRPYNSSTGQEKIKVAFLDKDTAVALCGSGLLSWDMKTGQTKEITSYHFEDLNLARFKEEDFKKKTTVVHGSIGYVGRPVALTSRGGVLKTYEDFMILWNSESYEQIASFGADTAPPVLRASFSSDGRFIQSQSHPYGPLTHWDTKRGGVIRQLDLRGKAVLLSDNRSFFTCVTNAAFPGEPATTPQTLDLLTGQVRKVFSVVEGINIDVAIASEDSSLLACANYSGIKIWNSESDLEPVVIKPERNLIDIGMVFSPDKHNLLGFSSLGHELYMWSAMSGKLERTYRIASQQRGEEFERIYSAVFSSDGKSILAGGMHTVFQLNIEDGSVLREFRDHSFAGYHSVAISTDGKRVLGGGNDGEVRLWDAQSGEIIHHLREHSDSVTSVSFSTDGKLIMSSGSDGKVILWDRKTGNVKATLTSRKNGTWIVVAPDGRYDSNHPGDLHGMSWVVPDDPLNPLPIEIFMKEYYEPRLLARILAGEQFAPIKSLSDINRVQPSVKIASIHIGDSNDSVDVTVEVAGNSKRYQRAGKSVTMRTGVYDLRLFRDGQMVAYAPQKTGKLKLSSKTGKASITFSHIKLPTDRAGEVEFSAYAFNVDGIKSATSRMSHDMLVDIPRRKPRAYVVSIGVNTYQNSAWNLEYAANDAAALQKVLADALKESGLYADADIVSIPLISQKGNERAASKARIKAVLDLLAGKPVSPALMAMIPNADKIKPANPEDFLLISYSGHGFADEKREFYLFPHDTGAGKERSVAPSVLKNLISSEELSLWLRDVDAGEMTMIVDACNSAASVEGSGFKPGPMGSRGLGQLAYDKGMRILTASQAESVALESSLIRHGVLTYSLIQEGISQQLADYLPQDKKIMMSEWLKYGVKRVPKLNQEIERGAISTASRGFAPTAGVKKDKLSAYAQQPSLFDFNKRSTDAILMEVQ